jgi:hypothetical protein
MIALRCALGILPGLVLMGCGRKYGDVSDHVRKGQTRQEIIAVLGAPKDSQVTAKQVEHIFGPAESFWSEIPMGARLVTWSYEFRDGGLALYFVGGSETLDYLAFAPKGVVY